MSILPFLAAPLAHQAIFVLIVEFDPSLLKSVILSYSSWFVLCACTSVVMSSDVKAVVSGVGGVSLRLRIWVKHGSPPPHSTLGSLSPTLSFSSSCKGNSSQRMELANVALLKRKPVHLALSSLSLTSIPLPPGNQGFPLSPPTSHFSRVQSTDLTWVVTCISLWRICYITAQPFSKPSSVIIPTKAKYTPEGHFVFPKMMWDN